MSVNPMLAVWMPALAAHLTDRTQTAFPAGLGIFAALCRRPQKRPAGFSGQMDLRGDEVRIVPQLPLPPFDLVLAHRTRPAMFQRDLTAYARGAPDVAVDVCLRLLVVESYTPFPEEYRPPGQVEAESGMAVLI